MCKWLGNSHLLFLIVLSFGLFSCSKNEETTPIPATPEETFLKGTDISFLPLIRSKNVSFYNTLNQVEDPLTTLKNNGANLVRIRLWHNPADFNSNFQTVKSLVQECKNKGFKTLLTVHYSDTWADPGNQEIPSAWQNLSFEELKNQVFNYTKSIVSEINPNYIQIGNEINNGFMWPQGNLSNEIKFKELLSIASNAIRQTNPTTKIVIHYAGHDGASNFFTKITTVDYDIMGLSYYPTWHGKDLLALKNNMTSLVNQFNKEIFLAETSYAFTLQWNDWTNNVVGSQDQLLPQFPASIEGQKQFLVAIKTLSKEVPKCIGFCYWGAEWISHDGQQSTNGSSWENQTLWDFSNKALPSISVFN